MKSKKPKPCIGNTVDDILNGPIKKKKYTEEIPSNVDSIASFEEKENLGKRPSPKSKSDDTQ